MHMLAPSSVMARISFGSGGSRLANALFTVQCNTTSCLFHAQQGQTNVAKCAECKHVCQQTAAKVQKSSKVVNESTVTGKLTPRPRSNSNCPASLPFTGYRKPTNIM